MALNIGIQVSCPYKVFDEYQPDHQRNGAYNVRIFGSVAKGEADEDSDVDFLVTVREGTSLFKLVGLWLDIKALIGHEVSLVDDQPIKGEFKQAVPCVSIPTPLGVGFQQP